MTKKQMNRLRSNRKKWGRLIFVKSREYCFDQYIQKYVWNTHYVVIKR